MSKRSSAILSIVLVMIVFLLGCSKTNHETLAFVGTESDMKTCYQIYPEDHFPSQISQELMEGRFPPDIVGSYEMPGTLADAYYEYYNPASHQYIPYPEQMYQQMMHKSMYIIIEEQVNGMAKLSFSTKKSGDYKNWHSVDTYIYGDSHNNNDFVVCYEFTEEAGDFTYIRGNIIKGTITPEGIKNIHVWSIIKDRTPKEDKPMIYNYYGYEHYSAEIAERK